jgi:IPT/TIG domain-containing protein
MRGLQRLTLVAAVPLLFSLAPSGNALAVWRSARAPAPQAHYGHLQARQLIRDLRHVPRPRRVAAASPRTRLRLPAPHAGSSPIVRSTTVTATPTQAELLANFNGLDRVAQISRFGSDQNGEPPDTQVAAGPDSVVEATNSTLSVWSKSGALLSAVDLNAFFGLPQGDTFSDPRVVYDAFSGRWFLVGLAFGPSTASLLAVSLSSDPGGGWRTYGMVTDVLPDQPKLGISADKVVIAWNDFSCPTCFVGQETQVIEKADLLAASDTPASVGFGPDPQRFSPVPAIQLTSTTTAFMVYNRNTLVGDPDAGPYVGVVRLTGRPASNNVQWFEFNGIPIAATGTPPRGVQPGSTTIETNDDRFLSAVWRQGVMWLSGNDTCRPGGDSQQRACLRLVKVTATDGAVGLLKDMVVGTASGSDYFPAVTTDAAGNLHVSFTTSSATLNPSVFAGFLPEGGATFLGGIVTPGRGPYNTGGCGGTNRWGDYSGAATDPSNPADVWLAGEFAASATDSCDWGTGIARLTLAAPTISRLTPSSGPIRGGTVITITGSEFGISDTSVSIGGSPVAPAHVIRDSSEQLRVTNPPHACGSTPVRVSTSIGASAPATFTYVGYLCAAAQRTTVPFRVRKPARPTAR